MTARRTTASIILLGALFAACGDDGDATTTATSSSPQRVSVEEAAGREGELVVAEGFVVAGPDADPRLCAALAESYPPQCGGSSLAVPGLPVDLLVGTSTNDDAPEPGRVVWTDANVAITGRSSGDELLLVGDGSGLAPGAVVVRAVGTCAAGDEAVERSCEPVPGVGIELWDDAGGVTGSTLTDALGVALFMVAEGDYEVVPVPATGVDAPPAVGAHAGATATTVTLRYG